LLAAGRPGGDRVLLGELTTETQRKTPTGKPRHQKNREEMPASRTLRTFLASSLCLCASVVHSFHDPARSHPADPPPAPEGPPSWPPSSPSAPSATTTASA